MRTTHVVLVFAPLLPLHFARGTGERRPTDGLGADGGTV
jgi:hypothetical protein